MTALLTKTTKMPCLSFSLPAVVTCATGRILAKEKGSVCYSCYARRNNYTFTSVINSQLERYKFSQSEQFVDDIVKAIHKEEAKGIYYFRWHDSGDIYSEEYLNKIIKIARLTPRTGHRIPTKETALISKVFKQTPIPENMYIQISAYYLNRIPEYVPKGCTGCMVYTPDSTPPEDMFVCPATTERKYCGDCRACWNKEIKLVGFKKH